MEREKTAIDALRAEASRGPVSSSTIFRLTDPIMDWLMHTPAPATLQDRVLPWMMECFGREIAADKSERNHRFIEEALELVQACGMPREEAHQLVEYVYGRDQGDVNQEVGGVMITLAALCLANGFDMHAAGETELARIWTKVEQIRAKQAAKPRGSALPVAAPAKPLGEEDNVAIDGAQFWEGIGNMLADLILSWEEDLEERSAQERATLIVAAIAPALLSQGEARRNGVVAEIAAERKRQVEAEGWSPEHDDEHSHGEMARAAVCYADPYNEERESTPPKWPWDAAWWKPKDRRRDLIRAAALIVAEIERLDRAAIRALLPKDGG